MWIVSLSSRSSDWASRRAGPTGPRRREVGAPSRRRAAAVMSSSASAAARANGGNRSMGIRPRDGASPERPPGVSAAASDRTIAASAAIPAESGNGGDRVTRAADDRQPPHRSEYESVRSVLRPNEQLPALAERIRSCFSVPRKQLCAALLHRRSAPEKISADLSHRHGQREGEQTDRAEDETEDDHGPATRPSPLGGRFGGMLIRVRRGGSLSRAASHLPSPIRRGAPDGHVMVPGG